MRDNKLLSSPVFVFSLLVSVVVVIVVHSAKKEKAKAWVLDIVQMFCGAIIATSALLITAEEIWWVIYYSTFEDTVGRLVLTFAIVFVILAMLHRKRFTTRIFVDVVESPLE